MSFADKTPHPAIDWFEDELNKRGARP